MPFMALSATAKPGRRLDDLRDEVPHEGGIVDDEDGDGIKHGATPLDVFAVEGRPIGLHELELRVHAEERFRMPDE